MCRIFGYFGANPPSRDTAYRISSAQLSGGPDAQSFLFGENWLVGVNRLAIQGVAPGNGQQPFSAGERLCLAFNGEIYNHHELRQLLERRGIYVEDASDGAVLLPLYQEFGTECFGMLNGMFSIAIIDSRESQKLLLVSDPIGVKSVYYYAPEGAGECMFASELPALMQFPHVESNWNREALDSLLISRAAWGEETFFRYVKTLRGGHLLEFDGGGVSCRPYRRPKPSLPLATTLSAASVQLRELLENQLDTMLKAEVSMCLILSGGLDSSLLCALAAKRVRNLSSFHVTYGVKWANDERLFAREVAAACHLDHHEVEIQSDDLPGLFERTVASLGQPNTAPHALSSYALFERIHKKGFRVAIAGEGADEVFGGYERFARALEGREGWENSYLDAFGAVPCGIRDRLYSRSFLKNSSEKSRRVALVDRLGASDKAIDRLQLLLSIDQIERFQNYILRRTDTLSMAHAVEVRVPFCQPQILAFGAALNDQHKISDSQGKRVVYEAARGVLPQSILTRRKQPFTLPIELFLAPGEPLFEMIYDLLTSTRLKQRDIWDAAFLIELLHQQSKKSSLEIASAIWLVAVVEKWFQLYVD